MVWKIVNPKTLTGLHYLCQECETDIIPYHNDEKIKQRLKSSKQESEDETDQNAARDDEHISIEDTVFPTQSQSSPEGQPLSDEPPRQ